MNFLGKDQFGEIVFQLEPGEYLYCSKCKIQVDEPKILPQGVYCPVCMGDMEIRNIQLCTICKEFDDTRYREFPDSKGYCKSKTIVLYSLEQKYCIDFRGVIPKIEVVIQNE